jgi:hypothetical protein
MDTFMTVPIDKGSPVVRLHDGTPFPSYIEVLFLRVRAAEANKMPDIHSDLPNARIGLRVNDGRVEVAGFAVEASRDGRQVTAAQFKWWNFEACLKSAINIATLSVSDGWPVPGEPGYSQWEASQATAHATASKWGVRRSVDDELLEQVAEIVKEHPNDPRPHICSQMYTSGRTASRWIAAARDRGFLPPLEETK